MRLLLLGLFLAFSPSARAVDPVPPAVPSAPAQYLPLSQELINRWGYDAEKVMALPPDRRLELQKELTMLEIGRLRRIELLHKIVPDTWQNYVTAAGLLTPEGM